MKPKPLLALKNFTVPIVMFSPDKSWVPRETDVRAVRLGNHRNRKSGCQLQARTHAGRNTTGALQGDGRRRSQLNNCSLRRLQGQWSRVLRLFKLTGSAPY